jgi:hypothetical protein
MGLILGAFLIKRRKKNNGKASEELDSAPEKSENIPLQTIATTAPVADEKS